MKRLFSHLALLLCLSSSTWAAPKPIPPGPTEAETSMGKKAAEEFEKDPRIKLLKGDKDAASQALLDKLNVIAKAMGAVSARPKIDYRVKVVEDDQLNAFTLPDGHIYIYRGLLDAMGSDDEIAAVLAHEIGHNALMHVVRGQAKAKKLSWIGLAAMAAALAGGRDGANAAQFSQYALAGLLNSYNVTYEKEADQAAIAMLVKTKYNPSAMVTLMERMEREENRRPQSEPGIFRTHPPSPERAEAARQELAKRKIAFTPRDVEGAAEAKAEPQKDRVAVTLGGVTLLEVAPATVEGLTGKERAARFAERINELMRENLKLHEIATLPDDGGVSLVARGIVLARATPADAKLQNVSPQQLAAIWRQNFGRLFWRETISGKM